LRNLFKVEEGQNAAGANTEGSEAAPPPIAAPAAPPEQPQQAAQPQSIELGQTTEQVVATLGQPSKIVKLGDKQIYIYKDLKVTFINGKVSNVE
jgi:nucleoid-associated protein YgaU